MHTIVSGLPRAFFARWFLFAACCVGGFAARAADPVSPLVPTIETEAAATVKAFNAADAAALGGMFLETGELVDEQGNVFTGRPEITALFQRFFGRFPQAKLEMAVTSVRPIGDAIAVEEGERRITAGTDGESAQVRYIAVRSRQGDRWPIASYREFTDEPLPTAGEMLRPLAWLVGDWVDEGPAGRTAMSFRWSDDGNYLLGDYLITADGVESKSTQRIGWDAAGGTYRSWTFDSDGGFTVGEWNAVEDGWEVVSDATLPDGTVGSATMKIVPENDDRFLVRSTGRIVGGNPEPDFELTITRRPPAQGATR